MSFLIYAAMLVAALVSVVMGLEVVSTPPVKLAKPALVEPIRHEAAPAQPVVPPPAPVAQQPTSRPPAVQPAPPQPSVAQQPMPQIYQPEGTTAQRAEPNQAPACNVAACTAAYRSFTASDCTYQPSDGPRKLCTRQ